MQPSELLARGYDLTPKAQTEGCDTTCGLCGTHITEGVPVRKLIKSATAGIADLFRGATHTCYWCAAAFGNSRITGNIYADEQGVVRPFVSIDSATPERPTWRDFLRRLTIGTPNVTIVTSNTKRRLWPNAVVSTYGEAWRPLFVDGDVDRVLNINVTDLMIVLDLIEMIYSGGIAKPAISSNLLTGVKLKSLHTDDISHIMQLEDEVARWRATDEFILALFIAQKVEE